MAAIPKPPKGFSSEAAAEWREANELYDFDAIQLRTLVEYCEIGDLIRRLQVELEKSGLMTADRFGVMRPNPIVNAVRDLWALRERKRQGLAIDYEPLRDSPGRPPKVSRLAGQLAGNHHAN